MKPIKKIPKPAFVALLLLTGGLAPTYAQNWNLHPPIFQPGSVGTFDEIAVKDPSLVYFEGNWHLFYTARGQQTYTTGYVSAPKLAQLNEAPRMELTQMRGRSRYGCAPQVFYFAPQNRWYLIFQTRDANYQPVFSTTAKIAVPQSWSSPQPLLTKDSPHKWIDFWVICDSTHAYLFYTEAHSGVRMRKTTIAQFPTGWGKSTEVLKGVHEAVHIYRVKGKMAYHMIYELNQEGIRSFGLATAKAVPGPWKKITDRHATGDQLTVFEGDSLWTSMVSHGEALRSGYDHLLEYDPDSAPWIIQGLDKTHLSIPYQQLPWKLGLISR